MDKTVENFLRFTLNDNLKRFIKEVDLLKLNVTENKSITEIINYIDESCYDINITLPNRSTVMIEGCKCFVDFEHDCVIVKQPNDSMRRAMYIALGRDDFRISSPAIRSGIVSFNNTLFTQQNETHLFEMLLSEDTYETNYVYKFNVDVLESIPKIGCKRLIMIDNYVFDIWRCDEEHIELRDPVKCQFYVKNPLQLLTDGYHPISDIEFMKRNNNGLLIPRISEIIPLCEYKPVDNNKED